VHLRGQRRQLQGRRIGAHLCSAGRGGLGGGSSVARVLPLTATAARARLLLPPLLLPLPLPLPPPLLPLLPLRVLLGLLGRARPAEAQVHPRVR
jgi:hypothetical protein